MFASIGSKRMQTNDFRFQKHLPANQYSTLSAQSQMQIRFLMQKTICADGKQTANGRITAITCFSRA
ncbi:MAG: hypothetical protein IKL85_09610 [Lentisphaeria bacterium]|nr:hypothetical protein [Lentisphaeria bacterium]